MPKVSVIIPVYNAEKYLRVCLESIINQTLKDIEIICIDDGSTDNSNNILEEFSLKDKRIKLFKQTNQGPGIARNSGIQKACGEYLSFIDSDDQIDLNYFECLYNLAKRNNYDIVKSNFIIHKTDGTIVQNDEMARIQEEIKIKKIPYSQFRTAWLSAIYKKDLLIKNNITFPNITYKEDVAFLYKFLIVAKSFGLCDNVYYHYLEHEDSTSHSKLLLDKEIKKYNDWFSAREDVLTFMNRIDLSENFYLELFNEKVFNGCLYNMQIITQENHLKDYRIFFERFVHIISLCKYDFYKYRNDKYTKCIYKKDYNKFMNIMLNDLVKNNNERNLFKNIFQQILSIKNSSDKHHKIITILGIKIKILRGNYIYKELLDKNKHIEILKNEQKHFLNFLTHKIEKDSVLYIEPNISAHAEVMPYYIKYFSDLGYQTDVIMQTELSNLQPFERMTNVKFNLFLISNYLNHIFLTEQVRRYKYIIFNSTLVYILKDNILHPNIFQYIPELNNYRDKLYVIEHPMESVNSELLNNHRCICLAKIPGQSDKFIVANPHYFGEVNITAKNDLTTFILVGAIENLRRNTDLLIDTVQKLVKINKNFQILVVGRGSLSTLPKSIRKYFKIMGRIPFPEMFKAMENADFFLPLFDANNPEHDRYISQGTSGSFQLIYGFLKPCLIHKKFADVYYFNNKNSIVYNENSELLDSMLKAINMPKEEYKNMQDNLNILVKDIEKESKENLDKIFQWEYANV